MLSALVPAGSVDLSVTSPPYYGAEKDKSLSPWPSYGDYLDDIASVFVQGERVMRENAKLCVNLPLMPISHERAKQEGWPCQHTRYLLNLASDVEQRILTATDLVRYDLIFWQKQTSVNMNGSYPYPGNNMINNTVEFIHIYVKPGAPPKFSDAQKRADKMSMELHNDLKLQVAYMYPASVKRDPALPPPFPEKLPARLIRFFTYTSETVLDPFCGTGTTCAVAKAMGRRYIGIDIDPACVARAKENVAAARVGDVPVLMTGRGKYPSQEELLETAPGGTRHLKET